VQGLPAEAVPQVVVAADNRTLPLDLRVRAIRLLGAAQTPEALGKLLALTDGGRTILGKRRLPQKSRELVAALAALARGWAGEPRAMEMLLLAALSPDPEIRAATDPDGAVG
jgi:hypothetical protein